MGSDLPLLLQCLDFLIRKLRSSDLNEGDNERVSIGRICQLMIAVQMTALHWCAYNNNSEGVRKLLQSVSLSHVSIISSSSSQGADIVLTDVDGKTALHWTASNDDDTTIRVLLVSTQQVILILLLLSSQDKAPTAVNLKDKEERTVLHLAVAAGNATVIMALVS